MSVPDWRLPRGVSRSVWEFAHDRGIARDEERHLADAPLLEFDRETVARWFATSGKLIDLGCGTGRALAEFSGRGFECVGIDISRESLAVAAERIAESKLPVPLMQANLCDLDCLNDSQFDYALLLFGTLGMVSGREHRRQVLEHARRILKPGGLLALHVHNVWRHLFSPQGRRWLACDLVKRLVGNPTAGDTEHDYRGIPRMYHHSFTRGELRRLLRDCGFKIREMIPLAPLDDRKVSAAAGLPDRTADLKSRGWFCNLRATGWLVLAETLRSEDSAARALAGRASSARP
ncbi:MAG: class I SAM-dependent methyltransferase [Deltaproteobacteria bacterium]